MNILDQGALYFLKFNWAFEALVMQEIAKRQTNSIERLKMQGHITGLWMLYNSAESLPPDVLSHALWQGRIVIAVFCAAALISITKVIF